ncbi:AAA family ATPase [Peribacillus sp. SI8-4]|uniref:AAA family ATPase n=1 Tax=Peribacillus sp. SI8-4 TaxID=3048009 RepID=UPI002552AD41|nr:AAA family ATPase [Peribacillus sp. SI8-4]
MNIITYPLFIVTGISGSGKSATSLELQKIMVDANVNIFDMDLIVNDENYQQACDNWLKVAYYSAYSGRNTVLFGHVPDPYDVEICDHFPFFGPVHYLHLFCNDKARTERLAARGKWTENSIDYMNDLSEKLVKEAQTSFPPIPTIDTSTMAPSQVAKLIKKWILKNMPD